MKLKAEMTLLNGCTVIVGCIIGNCSPEAEFKGTVRRDLRGVKNRLKRSVLINYKTASLYY